MQLRKLSKQLLRLGFLAIAFFVVGPISSESSGETPGTGKLRLVSTVWPPFTDVAERPRLASDLVHEALRRSGVEAETAIGSAR